MHKIMEKRNEGEGGRGGEKIVRIGKNRGAGRPFDSQGG